ncbi:MAG TPA: hypothetical protein GX701_05770 [Clostridiales bacterium]|nr:hypothetical protein [Clostridiales bacterium]
MKKNKLLLASAILGTAYLFYIVYYFFNSVMTASDPLEAIGAGIATALVAPHMFILLLAVIFNWIGWSINATWSALTGAILYCVSAFLFLIYTPFLVLQIIFSFVGFAKVRKQKMAAVNVANVAAH